MSEREDLEQAIATVEAQRSALGDAAVDSVLQELRRQLATLPAAGEDEEAEETSGGERRIVTVLFCDVTGSTALAERMDPEQWTEIMDQIFEYLIEPVDLYDGTVVRLMGDAILALFGAPVAHENDPQRAVAAGLGILENIRPYREELRRSQGIVFNVRVGINTGLVITGLVGSKLYEEYTALGDAANIAARMEQTAVPGTIQISEKTYRLVADEFDTMPLGEIHVKGKSKPVQTYRVIGRKSESAPTRQKFSQKINSNLVGRSRELQTIQSALARLTKGEGSILTVTGEAGVGKSRLIAEVRHEAQSINWLEGRTLSYGQTISYRPFQEIIWHFSGISEDDSEQRALAKLRVKLNQLFGTETTDVLPFIARLITLDVKGKDAEKIKLLDGEAMGHQIYMTTRRFYNRMAQEQPTVLAFEDFHWADESSARLLEHLLPLVKKAPILFLISGRPYRHSPMTKICQAALEAYPGQTREISLGPLSPQDSKQLARNLLEIDRLPEDVQTMIVSKASGNPFFLEEILRSLIDTGVVVYDPVSAHWQATRKIQSFAIPNTVQGVIMARVDRLDRDVRRVLQAASVIGRSFYYRVLEQVHPVDSPIEEHLTELEQVDLIRVKQAAPELEYIFNHALAQEATYQSILFRKRRDLHFQVGEAIENLFAERLEEFYGVLAYHYARAEEWDKAQEYLFKAGDKANQVAADAEALAHYQQALSAYERVFGDEWDPVQRAVLARKMGEAHFRRGDHERALSQFQQAFHFLGRPGIPPPHLATVLALGIETIVQIVHRLLPSWFVKPGSSEVSPEVEEEARLHNLLGWIFLFTERERFLWASLRRLNFAERCGYAPGMAAGGAAVGVVWDMIPMINLAKGYHRRASYLANQSGSLNALGISNQGYGFHELNLGNFDQSIAYVRRSEEVFRRAGELHGLGNALNLLAFNQIHQGHLEEAYIHIEELLYTGRDGADRQLICWGNITCGVANKRLGNLEQAEENLLMGLDLADKLPDYYWKILGQGYYGRCLLRQGRLDEAVVALDEGQRVHQKRGIGGPALFNLRAIQADTYLFAAEQSDGSERKKWMNLAAKALKGTAKLSKGYRLCYAESQRLHGTQFWLRGKAEEAQAAWQQSIDMAQQLNMQYELGLTYMEMGLRLQDANLLGLAESILSQIGANWHLSQLRMSVIK